jgi:hypothetical protein
MKVIINIRDKDLELVDVKEYEFVEFCDLLSRRITSCLYLIDDCLDPLSPVTRKDIRNNILDVAGDIRRLPLTIQFAKDVI